jgi:exopolyphosphatase/guanosine-5'-triphosphate,3'-diphosphate pyrophosphatase
MRRLAAIDIGSNTIHLLVADAGEAGLEEVEHRVETLELGVSVARTGRLGRRARTAVRVLARLRERARELGCEHVIAGATAAVRKAADQAEFLEQASAAIGGPVRLLSEHREAELSFKGVASQYAAKGEWLMVDLGGGSLELVVARGQEMAAVAVLPVGSGVLASEYLGDPPALAERQRLRRAALRELAHAPECEAEKLVMTGGTASNLPLVISRRSPPPALTTADLLTAEARLDERPAVEVARKYRLPEARIRALRAGVEVILLMLDWYGLDRLHVSHAGLRHGMLLAYLERGDHWWREQ